MIEKFEEKVKQMFEKIQKSPMLKKMEEEEKAELLTRRHETAGRIKEAEKARDAEIPRLKADVARLEQRVKAAQKALNEAVDSFRLAKAGLMGAGHRFETEIAGLHAVLNETYDRRIDEGLAFFQDRLAHLREPGRISRVSGGARRNLIGMTKTVKEASNRQAVLSALTYCQDSLRRLEDMKLSPEFDLDAIDLLKKGIPSIDAFTEIESERPIGENLKPVYA
ncbi:MAG: hypothetical protein RBT11_14700 [Desulfobacterales bacterium]|jgi:hypothetical protein|nr:hypothetical protein [Desulfobacterales bacterium]